MIQFGLGQHSPCPIDPVLSWLPVYELNRMKRLVFVNRRRGVDRRFNKHSDKEFHNELHPWQRRKMRERRDASRSLTDDYYAYMQKTIESMQSRLHSKKPKPKN